MKIIMSLALFEEMQKVRQGIIADFDPVVEFKPFSEERAALVADTVDRAHFSFVQPDSDKIEIVINDKLVKAVLDLSNVYGQTVFHITRVVECAMPAFMTIIDKVRNLFYQRL